LYVLRAHGLTFVRSRYRLYLAAGPLEHILAVVQIHWSVGICKSCAGKPREVLMRKVAAILPPHIRIAFAEAPGSPRADVQRPYRIAPGNAAVMTSTSFQRLQTVWRDDLEKISCQTTEASTRRFLLRAVSGFRARPFRLQ
jgi:hypothetical protein